MSRDRKKSQTIDLALEVERAAVEITRSIAFDDEPVLLITGRCRGTITAS